MDKKRLTVRGDTFPERVYIKWASPSDCSMLKEGIEKCLICEKKGKIESPECCLGNVMRKLAEYEDLEEQGLLLRLPCKIGDIVYIIHDNFIKEMRITYFCSATRAQHILFYAECTEQHEDCDCGNQSCCGIRFDDYNMAERHIYLTREAAESALREITAKGSEDLCKECRKSNNIWDL